MVSPSICGLTVLYDEGCPFCRSVRSWLERQPTYVPLTFLPAGSPAARAVFPALDHARTLREVTVVGDGGQVYEGDAAWIACLWATRVHRVTANRLATPAGRPLARAAVAAAARLRNATARPDCAC
jgi:predicted DCC family thiol-disulfide oxidoreductase YuxK